MKIEHIAERVCIYGTVYVQGDFKMCIGCAEFDKENNKCKDIESIMSMIYSEQDIIKKESFDNGVDEGRSAQAIIEIQGRERFLKELKQKQDSLIEVLNSRKLKQELSLKTRIMTHERKEMLKDEVDFLDRALKG